MNLPNGLPPLPVTIVAGFLGSGKTTLINHILRSVRSHRLGVLINDFGDILIDEEMVVAETGDVLTLANGCICCTLRGDLTSQIMALAESPARPEHLLVEASGISDPRTILEAMLELQRYQAIRLDGVITVVDASEHAQLSGSSATLAKRQRLAADLLILSKTDLVPPTRARQLQRTLEEETKAKIVVAQRGEVPLELLLGLEGTQERAFEHDPERALRIPAVSHKPELDWATWRFTTTQPIVFKTLVPILSDLPREIYRAKGFLHLVERPGDRLLLHLAGRRVQIRTIGRWGATLPRSELVLIGSPGSIDPVALKAHFEQCLEGEPGEPPPRLVGWARD